MKNNAPKSGFFSIRILLAWTLCSLAALLGVVSLPAPGGQSGVVLASSNAAVTQTGATSTSIPCPGPAICGQSCRLDPNGVPIYCSNGQCECAPGYDLQSGVCQPLQPEVIGSDSDGGYDCPGICSGSIPWTTVGSIYNSFDLVPVHGTAPGGEAFMPVWGYQATQCGDHGVGPRCQGGGNDGGICSTDTDCPGGTCNPIRVCHGGSNDGVTCSTDTDCPNGTCNPFRVCQGGSNDEATCSTASDCPGGTCTQIRTWDGCAPDPFPFCAGIQGDDTGDFDFDTCDANEGRGDCSNFQVTTRDKQLTCGPLGLSNCACIDALFPDRFGQSACDLCGADPLAFTSSWPYLDLNSQCQVVAEGLNNPARIDFPNNVSVYRAPIQWEDHANPPVGDDDYTMNMHSPGHELYDIDDDNGRVHVEFDSDESIDHFTDQNTAVGSFGVANEWWTQLRDTVDNSADNQDDRDRKARCFVEKLINPSLSTAICDALLAGEEPTCPDRPDGKCKDPMAVVVGVPSLDCGDHPNRSTSELHPAYAVAIRIQETCAARSASGDCTQTQPEQWAFFYRGGGDNGGCGDTNYGRCLSMFQLPLGLPDVPLGQVLTGADVHVDWHPWARDDTDTSDVKLGSMASASNCLSDMACSATGDFDLHNGSVVTITLPHSAEGVVGLVTVTPTYDTTPPTITCPNITTPVDLGKCTAAVTFTPAVSDNCSVSTACSIPSGSAFPIGTTTDTCTATDQAGLTASCSFNVTVTAGNKCPQAQGYWKNHPGLWRVSSLTLGTVTYNKTQLLSILNNSTTGDASVILAKAEIGALLNLANGSNPIPICDTIADANAALDGCGVPCKVGPKTVLGQRMVSDANRLDSYNLGKLTAGCTR